MTFALMLFMQAAAEYAAKAGGSALSSTGRPTVAGCALDSAVITCLDREYPRGTPAAFVVIFLIFLWFCLRPAGFRAR